MAAVQLDQATIAALAKAISGAIQQSGGAGRQYNPLGTQAIKETSSPMERAETMRVYQNSKKTNKIMEDLIKIQQQTNRTVEDLDRALKYNSKTLEQAASSYEDSEAAQKALVKNFQKVIDSNTKNGGTLKDLMGDVNKLEDALRAHDATKAITEVSKALIQHNAGQQGAATKTLTAIKELEKTTGKGVDKFADTALNEIKMTITKGLTDLGIRYNEATDEFIETFNNQDRVVSGEDREALDDLMDEYLKNANLSNQAKKIETTAVQANTASIEANTKTQKKMEGFLQEGSNRLGAWAAKVGTAAFVLDKLAEAAQQFYLNLKAAAATGVQRSPWDVVKAEGSALANGVDTKVLLEAQAKAAQARSAAGRGKFDDSLMAAKSEMFKITGDMNEALKVSADAFVAYNKSGVGNKEAAASVVRLRDTFNELQYLTGMTASEMMKLNAEIVNDADFKQSMIGLNEKERAAAIEGVSLMFKENALRGISIEQSKSMLKAQQELANPRSAKARLKNAAMIQQLGGTLGMDMSLAANVTRAGGFAQYDKSLEAKGVGAKERAEIRKQYDTQMQKAGTHISELQLNNEGAGFAIGGIGEKMASMSPAMGKLFDGTFDQSSNKAAEVMGDAATEFRAGVKDFIAGKGMAAVEIIKNGIGSTIGQTIMATVGTGILMTKGAGIMSRLTGLGGGAGGGAAGAGAGSGASGGLLSTIKNNVRLPSLKAAKGGIAGMVGGYALDKGSEALEERGHVKSAGAVSVGSSALSGASMGAMIGSAVPILGTAAGAAVGGVLGAGYGLYDNWNKFSTPSGNVSSPKPPSVSPLGVNNANNPALSSTDAMATSSTAGGLSATSTPEGSKEDPTTAVKKSMTDVTQTLVAILKVLELQTENMVGADEKSVEMQKRLQRAMKQSGSALSSSPATAAYNG